MGCGCSKKQDAPNNRPNIIKSYSQIVNIYPNISNSDRRELENIPRIPKIDKPDETLPKHLESLIKEDFRSISQSKAKIKFRFDDAKLTNSLQRNSDNSFNMIEKKKTKASL